MKEESPKLNFTYTLKTGIKKISDINRAIDFVEVLEYGGKCVLTLSEENLRLARQEFEPYKNPYHPQYMTFVRRLFAIQKRTGHVFSVPDEIRNIEFAKVNHVYQIITTGEITRTLEKITLKIDDLELLKQFYQSHDLSGEVIFINDNEYTVDILGEHLSLGKRTITGKGFLAEGYEELKDLKENKFIRNEIEICLQNVCIKEEFEEWKGM